MKKKSSSSFLFPLLVFVAGIGFLFVFIVVEMFFGTTRASFVELIQKQLSSPWNWLVYFLPVAIAVFAYRVHTYYEKRIDAIDAEKDTLQRRLDNIKLFIQGLINNKTDDTISDEFKQDPVAVLLYSLREGIEKSRKDEAQRRKEEEQRNWMTEGLAKFGEILRNNHDDIHELSYDIISNLVKYTDSNQGALFILNDEAEYNKFFDMTASYAYDRRKFADKRIDYGEGLLGTCALEKQTIYLTEIPEGYLNITSGLGKSNPRTLLLVPLNVNEQNFGVLEIASFHDYQKHHVEFIEKVAEGVASTISGVKTNLKTTKLLKESREQAEIMASQEEEMRQNMEELQATQEEAARQNEQHVRFSGAVDESLLIAELDLNGNFIHVNRNLLKKAGFPDLSYLRGQHYMTLLDASDKSRFDEVWSSMISASKNYTGEIHCTNRAGRDFWIMGTLSPVLNSKGVIQHVLLLAVDSSETMQKLTDYEEQVLLTGRAFPQARMDTDGVILSVNKNFEEMIRMPARELVKMSVFEIINEPGRNLFRTKWKQISQGSYVSSTLLFYASTGETIKAMVHFSGIRNLNSEITEVLMLINPESVNSKKTDPSE
jgi:PAS domain S-box-containing protein